MSRIRRISLVLLIGLGALYIIFSRPMSKTFDDILFSPRWRSTPITTEIPSFQAPFVKNFTFHKIEPLDLFVFSAFRDPRFDGLIRLVGMAVHQNHKGLGCLILSDGVLELVPAKVQFLPEGHGLKFDAVYVLCLSQRRLSSDLAVELRYEGSNAPRMLIPVQVIPSKPSNPGRGMAVCYPPLHNYFDDVEMFVENIEMNRILGFRQFFVYVYKVGRRVRRVIDSYVKEGVINVVSWEAFPLISGAKYPNPSNYSIHYMGQMVAINDCLYRTMNNPFRVVAFHDFDELIIPHRERSLSDVVAKEMGHSVSGLSVRCAMFDVVWKDDPQLIGNMSADLKPLKTQRKTLRLSKVLGHGERSKMLVIADNVITMGIHYVWHYHRHRGKLLPPEIALLHHYRLWLVSNRDQVVIDRSAWVYRAELLKNVKRKFAHFI